MLHILDILAVREAVRRQPRRLRVICHLLMQGYTDEEVAEELGRPWGTVRWQMYEIRKSFVAMGFTPPRRRRSGAAPRNWKK
ncbi:MAG TPA: hypothetical protein VNE39_28150 [Planctomycetota bacterium]|nr:hypothetical protein [Planctomycetota bacterium]